jgi:hypothetical protein|tara:strand:+ start:173 stop:481 length:309 start_codon:yes stop_codon:yes gene_type:complete
MSEDIKSRYQYVTQSDQAWTAIAIKDGKFNGVIYKYGKVTISENEDQKGNLPFRFEYDILDPYGLDREEFDDEFFHLIGDILVDIIDEQIGEESLEYNESNN